MKRAVLIAFVLMAVGLTALAVCSPTIDCPIHDGWKAVFTGNRMIDGTIVGVYHCPRVSPNAPKGHDFVVRCP
jgi:hypothetical protein